MLDEHDAEAEAAEQLELDAFEGRSLVRRAAGAQGKPSAPPPKASYLSAAPLSDGRMACVDALGASDSRCRRVVLCSLGEEGEEGAARPVEIRLRKELGEGEPRLLQPYAVCAAPADQPAAEQMMNTTRSTNAEEAAAPPVRSSAARGSTLPVATFLYISDRYHRMPRVLRIGVDANGVEAAPRLQFWDSHKERLSDPVELTISPDGRRLLVTDAGKHS